MENPQKLPKEINFATKPPELKQLPQEAAEPPHGVGHFIKKAGTGFGRTMCLPFTATVIAGCGFLAFLAFLFKIPTAAFLEQIGSKELAKKLTSDEEIGFFEKVVDFTWNHGVKKIGEDFGEAARSLRKIAITPLEDISYYEEDVDKSTSSSNEKSSNKTIESPSTSPSNCKASSLAGPALRFTDSLLKTLNHASRHW